MVLPQGTLDSVHEPGVGELMCGHVDAHPDVGHALGLGMTGGQVPAGLIDHPPPDLEYVSGVLGQGDEVTRGEQAASGMLPSDERLEPEQVA